ncbi:MAG TPA: FecR family protein [Vicinamibacterales bacterium]|nr:FecR family protein [Vicinamibacterales bacterium]
MQVTVCAVVLMLAGAPAFAQEQAAAGRIKIASGTVLIVRANATIPAKAGELVYEADTLRTGNDGRVGVTLKDDTRLSLGPNSEVRLDRFAFAPAEGRLAFVLRVVKGVAGYVSGQIAKIAPDAVRLETPSAIVGVRGTTIAIRVPQQ